MNSLTPHHHKLIELRLERGYSAEQIGILLGISEDGVKYHFRHINRILKVEHVRELNSQYKKYLSAARTSPPQV